MCVYMYMCISLKMYILLCVRVYIYIYREREGERCIYYTPAWLEGRERGASSRPELGPPCRPAGLYHII